MVDPQINIRVPIELKKAIKRLVESGKYRDTTDFMLASIREKLAREESGEIEGLKEQMILLIENDPDVSRAINKRVHPIINEKMLKVRSVLTRLLGHLASGTSSPTEESVYSALYEKTLEICDPIDGDIIPK